MTNRTHEKYGRQCFELAQKGAGFVSPNPLVGCVIVKDDEIISTGYHPRYGSFHAERNAILNSAKDVSGATLYCNLEPCSHTDKQTPPCAQLIISSNIKQVVISNRDPNPKVNGKGIDLLRRAGIEVITEILEDEGRELNRFYFKTVEAGLPYVTLKVAVSRDWRITGEVGKQTWLTGKESKVLVHSLRSVYDAVLIGANTVNIDNPKLTVREVAGRNPQKIILDGKLSTNLDSALFSNKNERCIVFCSNECEEKRKREFEEAGVTLIELDCNKNFHADINEVLKRISLLNINSVLVEGGAQIFKQFMQSNLFDELIVLMAPIYLEYGVSIKPVEENENLKLINVQKLGTDMLYHYKTTAKKCLPD
jgi:diaminohydroxyphosphoribosylaminopyrimidine deaminase/5-amino-6-(5-phosphoribosylamino)uracil reductase